MTVTAPIDLAHLVLRASAGSGKTYQLSERFLNLIGAGADPSSVLATTFTRLAAGEIRDRILTRLADAALDGDPDAATRLERVASRIHMLQVRTLDSFFAGVVRVFALELGLPIDLTLVDENEQTRLRQEALAWTLDQPDPEPLLTALDALIEGRAERSVTRVIDQVVHDLYQLYLETDEAAWHWMEDRPPLPPDRLAEAIERLRASAGERHAKAIESDCDRAEAAGLRDTDGWKAFFAKGLPKKIITGATTYNRAPIDADLVMAYEPLLRHGRAVLWNDAAYRTRSTWKLLDLFHDRYRALKHRRLMLTFDDLASLADRARRSDAFDSICFRLDTRIQHLLLDEFQDTSVSQWRALDPIAREIVADATGDRTFFCVGDVKQSIYGWREAAPEILNGLHELLGGAVATRRMDESRRSAQPVIDTVNRVFTSLPTNAAVGDSPEAVAFWRDVFREHTVHQKGLTGCVRLRRARAADGDEDPTVVPLLEAAELAAGLYRKNPRRTIGILCRRNKAVSRVLYELGPTRLNVPAMGHGGGTLTDAAPVNAILDALRMADHPDHTIAAFNVMHGPLGPVVGLVETPAAAAATDDEPTLFDEPAESPEDGRRRVARTIRRQLLERGYAGTIESWVAGIADHADPREHMRLAQLVDLAEEFDRHPSLRPGRFVDLVAISAIADQAVTPVNVMTVHKSKGLEFDIVILPELHGKLGGRTSVVMSRPGPIAPVERVVRWVHSEQRDPLHELPPMFETARSQMVREELCVLYVAMTRAKRGLFMLLPPTSKRSNGRATVENTLELALSGGTAKTPGSDLYECGDFDWLDEPAPEPPPAPAPAATSGITFAPPTEGPVARWRTAVAGPRAGSVRSALRLSEPAATDRGTAIHLLFEQVEWIDDFEADEETLVRLVRRELPRRGETWAAGQVRGFRDMLEQPAIRDALTRSPDASVWRERPFARFDASGRIVQGRIDRLVSRGDRALVIDFKTDAVEADTVAEAAERHRGQLEGYRDAAAEMLGLETGAVAMTLVFVGAGLVHTL